jgi:hypothetical protein
MLKKIINYSNLYLNLINLIILKKVINYLTSIINLFILPKNFKINSLKSNMLFLIEKEINWKEHSPLHTPIKVILHIISLNPIHQICSNHQAIIHTTTTYNPQPICNHLQIARLKNKSSNQINYRNVKNNRKSNRKNNK